jgi:hypothetical protein
MSEFSAIVCKWRLATGPAVCTTAVRSNRATKRAERVGVRRPGRSRGHASRVEGWCKWKRRFTVAVRAPGSSFPDGVRLLLLARLHDVSLPAAAVCTTWSHGAHSQIGPLAQLRPKRQTSYTTTLICAALLTDINNFCAHCASRTRVKQYQLDRLQPRRNAPLAAGQVSGLAQVHLAGARLGMRCVLPPFTSGRDALNPAQS